LRRWLRESLRALALASFGWPPGCDRAGLTSSLAAASTGSSCTGSSPGTQSFASRTGPTAEIDIICSAELRQVAPRHRRAHQGWRYLVSDDAPSAGDDGTGLAGLPPRLYGRLAALALV
jgi:hypothetical protein